MRLESTALIVILMFLSMSFVELLIYDYSPSHRHHRRKRSDLESPAFLFEDAAVPHVVRVLQRIRDLYDLNNSRDTSNRSKRYWMSDAGYGSRVSASSRLAHSRMAFHSLFGSYGPGKKK